MKETDLMPTSADAASGSQNDDTSAIDIVTPTARTGPASTTNAPVMELTNSTNGGIEMRPGDNSAAVDGNMPTATQGYSLSAVAVEEEKKTDEIDIVIRDVNEEENFSNEPAKEKVGETETGKESANGIHKSTDSTKSNLAHTATAVTQDVAPTQSLEDSAGIVSSWLLSYLDPLLKKGSSKILDESDLGVPSKIDDARHAFETTEVHWKEELLRVQEINRKGRKKHEERMLKAGSNEKKLAKLGQYQDVPPNLTKVLWTSFGYWEMWWATFLYAASSFLQFVPVLLLNDLVTFFEQDESINDYPALLYHPWGDVIGLFVFPTLVSILQTRSQTIMAHCAVFVRTSVSTLLYSKALTISAAGRAQTSTGQVVNMMSNDTAQLQRFLQFFGMVLVAPVQIIVSLVLIYRQVGNATWVGVAFMVALAPVSTFVMSNVGKMRRKCLKYSDLRVKMVNEIMSGIRIIKFYAWERPFSKELNVLREKELKALTALAYTSAVGFSLVLMSAPILNPILVFLTYVNTEGKSLDAATAFTTIALFNIMRFPFAFLPMGLLQFVQAKIALRRISNYLGLPELESYVIPELPPSFSTEDANGLDIDEDNVRPSNPAVVISNGSFSWVDPDASPTAAPTGPPKSKRQVRKEAKAAAKQEKKQKEERSKKNGNGTSSMTRNESLASLGVSVNTAESDEENTRENRIALKDVTCTIEEGSLVAVVGSVGSGKSSLLSAILGEMEALDGSKVYIPKQTSTSQNFVSYSCQTPWVVNDTVKDNILFGRQFDEDRYNEVVAACALVDDLAVLPAGDLTEIGERGINLSGGQKARVSLARAMYSRDTKLMLLDDPLSAVDAHVGEHLFRVAIQGDISRGSTKILVTHHVHFLPRCDKVIMLEKGRIKEVGTYAELLAKGVDFAGAVDAKKTSTETKPEDKKNDDNDTAKADDEAIKGDDVVVKNAPPSKGNIKERGTKGKLVSDEEREEGSVDGSMYTHYASAGGWINFIMLFVIQGLGRGAEIMAAFWLSTWAEATIAAEISGIPLSAKETTWYLNIYAVFGIASVVGLTARAIIMAVHRLRASKKLHDDLTNSILRAPVSFFDVTPIGRVLNRFSADMDKIDLQLTQSLGQGVSTMFSVLGAVAAIIAATKGTLLVVLIPIGYLNYIIQKWFRRTSTELQRVASIANSPIFADFSQTISGTQSIRAYGEQNRFFTQCQNSFDKYNTAYTLTQLTNFWLGLRLDVIGGTIGAFIGAVALFTSDSNFIPAGWVGLALAYSIEVTGFLKHGVRMIATVEAEMNSVERVLYYSTSIESEAPLDTKMDPNPAEWPSEGEIKIEHASMRYRDGPLVLKDLNVSIRGGEKIGVVGRTGSGKSSLMTALFRITELEPDGRGKISIDGVDVSKIGLDILRLNLSIIPQDPVMFSNSVRYNLDPFGEKSEYELWEVLKKVQLAEVIAILPGGLDEQVTEGGENFSQGQRQLLCIARSLLRKPKILVMDEATASIDNATDALIQKMIRENFENATLLTIAHRLNTIMDSDRVLVLDEGRVAEFDKPSALLDLDDGIFAAMVAKSKKS